MPVGLSHLFLGIIRRRGSFKSDNLTCKFKTFLLPGNRYARSQLEYNDTASESDQRFRGKVHHIISNSGLDQNANKIFQLYQEQAADGSLPFRRWPLRSVRLRLVARLLDGDI